MSAARWLPWLAPLCVACGSEHARLSPVASTETSTSIGEAPSTRAPGRASVGASSAPSAAPSSSAPSSLASSKAPDRGGPPRAFDMHCDTPYQVRTKGRSLALDSGHITPDTLRRGHVGGVFFAIYLSDKLHDGHPTIADADLVYETIDDIVAHHQDILWPAEKGPTPDGMVTAFASIEGAGAFAEDITQIDRFIARGVRFVGLVHMKNDALSSSATDKHTDGLTELGKKFARRVYDKGALVDVSHMSDEGFWDVAGIAKEVGAPIVATHSDARALADHPRNLTDEELAAIGASGGVVGVNFYGGYLKVGGEATLADAVAQAMYMVKVAGIDHVGIGSDFDGSTPPTDLADASYYPAFARGLAQAGLSDADIRKVFSENVKRVLAWREHRGEPKGDPR